MLWFALGATMSLFGDNAEDETLKKKQLARIGIYKSKEALAKFAIDNNTQRANEIAAQQGAAAAEAGRDIVTKERKAIGQEVIRRGEGITAGASVQRSVDDVIAQGNKAKADVAAKREQAFVEVQSQARQANARELANLDMAYHNMVAGIEADQAQKKSGMERLFGAVMGGASTMTSGAKIETLFK